jgi:T-complex protein 1 subunit theta
MATFKVENPKNSEEIVKYLKSAIASKQYGYEDILTPIIAKACIEVTPKNPSHFNVDNVCVTCFIAINL